ncbi:HD domain-containing protein [Rhodothermus marinus]|uniref:HD domain-containing protein n=1 Tax=Rhodothermus marinus TaxID=29549 RepID=UPI00396EC9CB
MTDLLIGTRSLAAWEPIFEELLQRAWADASDPAHDLEHVRRVVRWARRLALAEGADLAVVLPAAWLHDCVLVPKDHPERPLASRKAADRAVVLLREAGYPESLLPAIHHAIEAHSFSAGIPPRTLEACVVQDADRLDALGAIGLARMVMLGGATGRPLYDPAEPVPRNRLPDDRRYVLDHLFTKLLHLADRMQTEAGRREAQRRAAFLQTFLEELQRELAQTEAASVRDSARPDSASKR